LESIILVRLRVIANFNLSGVICEPISRGCLPYLVRSSFTLNLFMFLVLFVVFDLEVVLLLILPFTPLVTILVVLAIFLFVLGSLFLEWN
jgi:hypothetical protein